MLISDLHLNLLNYPEKLVKHLALYFLLSLNNKIDDQLLLTLFLQLQHLTNLVEISSSASKDLNLPDIKNTQIE